MKNKVITAGFVLLLVIIMGGGLLYMLLPYVADTYLLPRVARDLPFD